MEGKKVLVLGAARSGIGSAQLLLRNKADVVVYDQNREIDEAKFMANFTDGRKPRLILGELAGEEIRGVDFAVISPGIPPEVPFVKAIEAAGVPIWGEIELAVHFNQARIAAITGTNGKTTTTTLVGEIFKAAQPDSLTLGNIGISFSAHADKTHEGQLISLEIGSFQLETAYSLHPEVAALLNLTPDHLDRHKTFENYAAAKMLITKNQNKDNYFVLNFDDPEVRKRGETLTNVHVIWFSHTVEPDDGVFVRDGWIIIRNDKGETPVLPLSEIPILGWHNVENVLAAVAITYYMGIDAKIIRETVKNFSGVEHRIEYVRTLHGVKYYNDSKGTNPDAAIKAIQAMDKPTLLIGGGYDKRSTYDEWIEAFGGKVRYLVLLGKTAQAIEDCAMRHGFRDVIRVNSLEEAVRICYELARPGDNVLLSPACASWDMFKDYEERGRLFKEYVRGLEE